MMIKNDKSTKKHRHDLYLIISICVISAILYFIVWINKSMPGEGRVIVYLDQQQILEFPLDADRQEWIDTGKGHRNLLQIRNGKVSVSDANCRDHLCVKQGEISGNGESIICLPHRLTITIENNIERELDAVSG